MWCQFALILLLIWVRALDQLTNLVVFAQQIINVLIIGAVLVLRKKLPDMHRPYKVWGGAFTVILAIVVNLALMINTFLEDPVTAIIGVAVMAVGIVVYFIFDAKLKKEGK